MERQVIVSGGFDDLRSRHLRFLEEAAKLGEVTVLFWPDETMELFSGAPPKFPASERLYLLNAVRYVTRVIPLSHPADTNSIPQLPGLRPEIWIDEDSDQTPDRRAFCQRHDLEYVVLPPEKMDGFATPPPMPSPPGRKKVVVTGCYDWFHSGHVRFFEEVSTCGDLYVIVGHDANIRLLKGQSHPLVPQEERRYVVGSIKHIKQALISSGHGWLDADPEIRRLKPDIYAVNEDGDRGGKQDYCRQHGIEYLVLRRTPAPGLTARTSTGLRGF